MQPWTDVKTDRAWKPHGQVRIEIAEPDQTRDRPRESLVDPRYDERHYDDDDETNAGQLRLRPAAAANPAAGRQKRHSWCSLLCSWSSFWQ